MVSPKTLLTATMMLYKNTKTMVYSSAGDTDFFDNVARVFQGDTLALYLFILCLHPLNVNRFNKRK